MQQPPPHLRFRFSGFCYSQSNGVRKYYMENSRQKQLISFKLLAVPSRVTESHCPIRPAQGAIRPGPACPRRLPLAAMPAVSQGCVKSPDATSRGPAAQEQRRCTSDPPGEPKARPSCEKEGAYSVSGILLGPGTHPLGSGDSCPSPAVTVRQVGPCRTRFGRRRSEARKASMKGFESGRSRSAGQGSAREGRPHLAAVFTGSPTLGEAKAFTFWLDD